MRRLSLFLDRFWISFVAFVLLTTLATLAASMHGLQQSAAVFGLLAGLLGTGFLWWKTPSARPLTFAPPETWFWRSAAWICFALFSLRAFLWLIFLKDGQIAVLSRNNLGDLPLHIQYIRFFSHGAPLWPVNPIHAHSTIGYPFGIDYFNAILDVCGLPLWNALIATGILGSLAAGIALYRWGKAFGMAGFLFNGGAAGLAIFTTGKWLDYQQEMDWKSIPLALFVTQRGFLYALPAGLLLLATWRRHHAPDAPPGKHPRARLPFWLEWLIYATLPLFHLHTFLFLSAILAALALFGENRARLRWLGCAAVPPATLLIYLLTDGFHTSNSLGWHPGWMQGDHFSAIYWLRNFGALPFFAAWLIFVLVRKRDVSASLFAGPALLIFIATLFIKFSPWEWDNTKLMMWSWLVLLPFIWKTLLAQTPLLVRAASCFLLFASGFVSLWGGLAKQEQGYDLAEQATVLSVQKAVEPLPILATFAAAPSHTHPLVFAGRRLALAYHGHMVGHGIPYAAEKAAMDQLMNGSDNWREAAHFLGVRYLYWGLEEEKNWPASEKPWMHEAKLIATEAWGELYELP